MAGGPAASKETTLVEGPGLRPVVVASRARLARGRDKLRRQHERGSPGIQVSAGLTDLVDSVVLRIHEAALADLGDVALEPEVAVVAIGGYGRRDLAPFSDVDLMLLTTPEGKESAARLARHLTRDICDVGLRLGFSFRTIGEACSLALRDVTIFTALAESRLLAGNMNVFRRFLHHFRRLAHRRRRALLEAIVQSRRAERRQFGETVYLLEPNVKRSRGGLRDVHTVRWIGLGRHGQADLESLYRLGALTRVDWRRLRKSHEFLLRLRNELHFHAGKSQDVLTRDEQVRLAESYGYDEQTGLLPVEQFMRDYFKYTSGVRYISAHFVASSRARSALHTAAASMFSRHVGEDFLIGPVHIAATRKGLLKVCSDLGEVLRIMDLANRHNKRIDHTTWEAIRNAMVRLPDAQISGEVANRFMSLLSQPGRLADLLRRLHQLRVLERIIPAVQHARNLVQFNDYHKYTIDEHCIRAVEQATRFLDDPGPVGEAYRNLRDRRLLHLALLIHDLGKGYPEDHSEVGERIAADTAQRLGLSERDAEVLRFLVRRHLLMPHMAFRQDLRDESVAIRLAVEVGSPDILQMLFILSCADLAAVGPGVLNDWKRKLLIDLYRHANSQLTGEDKSEDVAQVVSTRRDTLQSMRGPSESGPWWDRQIDALPATYLWSDPPERIFQVLQRLSSLQPNCVEAWYRHLPDRKTNVCVVGTYETITPGVFHKLTGALTGKGLQILSAHIHALADGLLLDRFYVDDADYDGEPPEQRVREICDALVAALTVNADKPPAFRRLWQAETGTTAADYAQMPAHIRFDDATSEQYTIITILTYDRRGLLYSITRTLFELGVVVHSAKIGTYLDQVVDVFYVTDVQGRKIYDDPWLAEIRQKLNEALSGYAEP